MSRALRLVIAGSRSLSPTIEEIDLAVQRLAGYPLVLGASPRDQISEVICGDARGVDRAGAEWARAHEIAVHHEPITEEDIRRWGKYLGPKARNGRMAERGDILLAFWDGKSSGTPDMVTRMIVRGKRAEVVPMRRDRPRAQGDGPAEPATPEGP